ncbi:MAG: ribosome assembly RNA-binding protein YhbY [Phycisphaeraceae bacterium]
MLTTAEKRALKQRGQTMPADCRLGKAQLSEGFLANLNRLLDQRELIKLRFTELEGRARKELAEAVCAAVGAELVQVVGRTVLMYRPKPNDESGSSR